MLHKCRGLCVAHECMKIKVSNPRELFDIFVYHQISCIFQGIWADETLPVRSCRSSLNLVLIAYISRDYKMWQWWENQLNKLIRLNELNARNELEELIKLKEQKEPKELKAGNWRECNMGLDALKVISTSFLMLMITMCCCCQLGVANNGNPENVFCHD